MPAVPTDTDTPEPAPSAPVTVRAMREADLPAVCDLINGYIRTTAINFRTQPQTVEEWRQDWRQLSGRYPWLVATFEGALAGTLAGTLAGVAYAGPWKTRAAYDWCAEVTVYVAPHAHRRGAGRALYGRLLRGLDAQGYRTMVGVIALPNAPSVALHEACGFQHAGTLRRVGYKFGAWHDVGFWQRQSARAAEPPAPLLPVGAAGPPDPA
jgi:phosphinothricin acetyltransferase